MRRGFVANVSHELRTPLTVISGFVEHFLGESPPTGQVAKRFHTWIAEQSGRMTCLVVDLLALSRLENDTQPPADEIIPLPEMLESLRVEAEALADGEQTIRCGRLRESA
ncbi:MAG: hypothetical protein JNL84_02680 [Candidatus Accumulibacter sp.]|nr:hypothetical protein [Accumulibacter sp.]